MPAPDLLDIASFRSPKLPRELVRLSRRQAVLGFMGLTFLEAGCRGAEEPGGPMLTPEQFGARGDGLSDDTEAFERLNRAIAAAGGGVIPLRNGAVYRVGRQRPSPGRFLTVPPILHARGVDRFVVRMNGATLKYNDNLKFGAFDRRTGARLQPVMPFVDRSAAADLGHAILAEDVRHFEVTGGIIDLNSGAMEVGGQYGDKGWQLPHVGVCAENCAKVIWADVQVRNSCLDGFLYTYSGPKRSDEFPLEMRDCSVDRAARNCLSITGCQGALIERCRFERAGEAPGGPDGRFFGSAPKSCLDVEAEGTVCRHVVVRNCELRAGAQTHTAFVADSGDTEDILIESSVLRGIAWSSKPRTVFRNCQVFGGFGRLLAGRSDPAENALIEGCSISDRRWEGDEPAQTLAISGEGAAATARSPLHVRNCTFELFFNGLNLRGTRLERVTVNVRLGTDTLPSGTYLMFLAGATIRGMRIVDRIVSSKAPAVPYYIHEAGLADIANAEIVSPAARIFWNAPTTRLGGYSGKYRADRPSA